MINQELIQYIKQASARGDTKEAITKVLLENGWNNKDVEEGLQHCVAVVQPQPVEVKKAAILPGTKTSPSFSWSVQRKDNDLKPLFKTVVVEKEKVTKIEKVEKETVKKEELPQKKSLQPKTTEKKTSRIVGTIVGIIVFVGILCAAGYYVVTKTNLFKQAPLDNKNVLSSIVGKINTITMANYAFSMEIGVKPRDVGAKPISVSEEDLLKYKRDEDRMRDIQQIVDKLNTIYRNQQDQIYQKTKTVGKKSIVVTPKYPTSLEGLSLKTADQTGLPYIYATMASSTGYSLMVTFETQEAVDSFYSPYSYSGANDANTTKGKTVTITEKSYFYASNFSGKPAQPKLFGLFDLSGMERYISADTKGKMFVSGTVNNSKDIPADAKLIVGADATFGDASFAFEAEGIKKGDNFFGIVHKLPTFFSSMGQIRGTWVMVTKDDLLSFVGENIFGTAMPSSQNEINDKLNKQREQAKILLRLADEEGIVAITSGPEKVTEDGEKMMKYKLSLVKEKMLPFYEKATKELEKYDTDSLLKRDEKMVEYLKGEDFLKTFSYLKENTTFSLWVNNEGFPVKMEVDVRYIPADDIISLKEQQIDLITAISFKDINKKVVIEEPKQYVTIYEMLAKVTGQNKAALLASRQGYNVNNIRNALNSYYSWAGKYPTTLDELKQKRKDVPITAGSEYQSGYSMDYYKDREFLKIVPFDIYTNKLFEYSVQGKDYQLVYQMKMDPYAKNKDPRSYYNEIYSTSTPYTTRLVTDFVEGVNTANKTSISVEAEKASVADDDSDGLPNVLETIFGTDPKKVDTDGDGFSDKDEIKAGSDPTGPGKLKYKSSYSSFFF
jgi:hypothetical protein